MSASSWTATKNGTARTPTLKQLKPWRHGLPGSAAACFTGRSRSASCGSRQPGDTPMGEVVELHDQLVHLADNEEFIVDCCRFAENILTEAAVRKKYRM